MVELDMGRLFQGLWLDRYEEYTIHICFIITIGPLCNQPKLKRDSCRYSDNADWCEVYGRRIQVF